MNELIEDTVCHMQAEDYDGSDLDYFFQGVISWFEHKGGDAPFSS